MCRSIKPLFNFDPPATKEEIRSASLQYVRKLSGFTKPSLENEQVFNSAVEKITKDTEELLITLKTPTPHKNREVEAQKAKERSIKRFGVHE
jgi:hypothetical protein